MRKIIILLIIFASNTNLFGQIAFDTITNWQLYKDSELLIKSNIVESQHYSVIVNNETNYESINFQIFYDYFSDTLNRKVIFKYKDSIIASYNDKNQTHRKFIIPKEKLTKDLSKYRYKKLKIIYIDKFNPNGLVIGNIIFVETPFDVLQIPEIRYVLQLALDLPELQKYFHVKEFPERKPLKLLEYGLINSDNIIGLKKFGLPIKFIQNENIKDSKDYIGIGDWTPVNGKLRLQLYYPAEGITINYMFEMTNENWRITDSIIFEE